MSFISQYVEEAGEILKKLDHGQIEKMIQILLNTRENGGRLFIIGVGGSAANCTHAVNDFRKLAHIETYSPVDNVAELTARTNDEGWDTVFSEWLKISNVSDNDTILVFSVGGGNEEKNVSPNIVTALELCKKVGTKIIGVVGRDGGHTAKVADACVIIPTVNESTITPHAEAFQGLVWHLIVADPRMMKIKNKWESLSV
ncbi:MAG: SIS domain-containing protein [Rhodospirillales bacterium]|nr:SIS domain-containing protein [Rhodospirillales bacterium]